MKRYKIIIQYDGTNFSGFQSQKNQSGIQDKIEYSIASLNHDKKVRIYGASRTDTGVHALGQVAHFDLDSKLNDKDLLRAINARLDRQIRISSLKEINENFHSRFDAISKEYNYLCCLSDNPLLVKDYYYIKKVDFNILSDVSKIIEGEHDFLSFSKFSNKKNNYCKIFTSKWVFDDKNEEKLSYIIYGNRFLHHMVRYLVGTMIAVSQNKISMNDFKNLLEKPRKDAKIFKAPSNGLILKEIFYED
tara:strand:- start:942 stop:1682 length:741 start_codon:yes stop_codon:yes gene_type:complete